MGAPELQGEDGRFQAVVEQPAELRMVMRFGGGKLLHVGRVVTERLVVKRLEVGTGDAGQVLDGLNVPVSLGQGEESFGRLHANTARRKG